MHSHDNSPVVSPFGGAAPKIRRGRFLVHVNELALTMAEAASRAQKRGWLTKQGARAAS